MPEKFQSIDSYIASLDAETQEMLQKVRAIIKEIAPEAEETISYNMPTFKIDGTYFVYFAAFKNHLSLYPANEEAIAAIPELKEHKTSTGTFQFKFKQGIPLDLIKKFVEYRKNNSKKK